MLRKKIFIVILLAALVGLLAATSASASKPPVIDQVSTWEITKAKVVAPGQTGSTNEGMLTTGYAIEAKVKAKSGSLLPDGTIRLSLTAFSPAKNLPGQVVGKWYVQGQWTITQLGADPKGVKARHNPYVAQGTFAGVLDFNPAATPGNWTAKAILPMSLTAGQWGRGEGYLTLDAQNNGYLYLDLKVWPKAR